MKIAWYCDSADYLELAAISVASARRVMPHAHLVQLGTLGAPRMDCVDEVILAPADGNIVRRRSILQAPLIGEWLFVDVDILFRRDVSDVFNRPFDVALPLVIDPNVKYSNGVAFSRTQKLNQEILKTAGCSDVNATARIMLDAVAQAIRALVSRGEMLPPLQLPSSVYECIPRNKDDACLPAAMVHFRGPRKAWMSAHAETLFEIGN